MKPENLEQALAAMVKPSTRAPGMVIREVAGGPLTTVPIREIARTKTRPMQSSPWRP
jgi:hypothetical protein